MACFVILFAASAAGGTGAITYIDKDQLKDELGKPRVTIIDVRTTNDWDSSEWKIQGAQRQSPAETAEWIGKYPKEATIVLYCA
jgi:rhodanese-related sulfurtransferase